MLPLLKEKENLEQLMAPLTRSSTRGQVVWQRTSFVLSLNNTVPSILSILGSYLESAISVVVSFFFFLVVFCFDSYVDLSNVDQQILNVDFTCSECSYWGLPPVYVDSLRLVFRRFFIFPLDFMRYQCFHFSICTCLSCLIQV